MSATLADGYPAVSPELASKLVLTYNNTAKTDGVGAQLQRIYGTYAIARLLGAAYLHSPVERVDYQGLSALEANAGDPCFHHEFNELFQIASDVTSADGLFTISLPGISLALVNELADMFDRNQTGKKPVLVRLEVPYGIAEAFPDCYSVCKDISPFASPPRQGRPLRVAVHVRRGELLVLDSDRMLPNTYYLGVAREVAASLDALELDYQIELWTEVPRSAFTVQPDHHGMSHRISAPVAVAPEMTGLDDFASVPKLVQRINGRAIDCIRQLATADVLVMSRSSFSYLGGILNRSGVVLYHPFWHHAPSSWITVEPDGTFARRQFESLLAPIAEGCSGSPSGNR
jgi:hypothetical protein